MNILIRNCILSCLMITSISLPFSLYAQKSPSIVGTYIYSLEDREGMCIFTKTHFLWLLSDKKRSSFQGAEPSEPEKAIAWMAANADGGTYKYVGPSRITIHRLFSTDPGLVGKEFTFEYEFDKDICSYWILQADGSRGPKGTARRVEK